MKTKKVKKYYALCIIENNEGDRHCTGAYVSYDTKKEAEEGLKALKGIWTNNHGYHYVSGKVVKKISLI